MWLHVAHIFLHLKHHQYKSTEIILRAMLLFWDKLNTAKNFYSLSGQKDLEVMLFFSLRSEMLSRAETAVGVPLTDQY